MILAQPQSSPRASSNVSRGVENFSPLTSFRKLAEKNFSEESVLRNAYNPSWIIIEGEDLPGLSPTSIFFLKNLSLIPQKPVLVEQTRPPSTDKSVAGSFSKKDHYQLSLSKRWNLHSVSEKHFCDGRTRMIFMDRRLILMPSWIISGLRRTGPSEKFFSANFRPGL